MSARRDVQLSMVDGMERPVGPILPSVFQGTNADLMAAVAPLYLTGSVLDVTYGNGDTAGGWWRRFTPEPFTFHDLDLDGVDFRCLPHIDGEFSAVCFDPPYVPAGGGPTNPAADGFRTRFGLEWGEGYRSSDALDALIAGGLAECCRVSSDFVLVKCMEFVSSGRFRDMPTRIINWAAELGMGLHDRIVHHTGPGPGNAGIKTVLRARRHHSYLLVFVPSSAARLTQGES